MGDADQHSTVPHAQTYDNIGSPRLRRLWGPIVTLPGSNTPSGHPTPRRPAAPLQKSPGKAFDPPPQVHLDLLVIDTKYEATGSLLPQPFLSTPRGGNWAGGGPLSARLGPPGEATYSFSTIRRVHALVLQASLDLSFGTALERVVTAAKTITNSRHAQIFFLERNPVQPGGLCSSTSFGLRLKGRGTQDKVFPSQGLAGVCAAENMPVISNRPHHDVRFNPDIDWAPGSGAKTVACAPMTNLSGKVVGVIQVCNKIHAGYMDEDMHFLDMLARQAAVTFDMCIKNDQRQMQIRKTTSMLKGFVKLAGKASPAELAHKSGLLCKEVCGASQASCFLVQDENGGLTSWSKLSDGKADVFTQNKVPIKGFLAEVFKDTEEPGGNVSQHLGSLYCPIICGGKPTGVLQARGSRKGNFSDLDEQMLKMLSAMVATLHQNLERSGMTARVQSGKPWDSVQTAIAEIDKTILDGLNCQKTALLFVEQETQCFWMLDPKGDRNDYIRLPLGTFPLSWVVQNKALLAYPCADSGGEGDSPVFTPEETQQIKALARRISPNIHLECMLACPITKGADGECVAILLIINKHNSSGPFEPWVSKSALTLSSKWGARLAVTLHDELSSRQMGKLTTTNLHIPGLFMPQSKRQVMAAISKFVKEFLFCEECWVYTVDPRKAYRDKLTLYSLQSEGEMIVKSGDAGCAGDALHQNRAIICQEEDSWVARKVKYKIGSAVAVPIHKPENIPGSVLADSPRPLRQNSRGMTVGAKAATPSRPIREPSRSASGFSSTAPSAILVALNKLGQVAKFSPRDAEQLEQVAAIVGRVLDINTNLQELANLQNEMQFQSEQRNLIVEQAAHLHHGALLPNLSTPTGLLSRATDMVKSVLGASQYEMQEDLSEYAFLEDVGGIAGHAIKTGNTVLHSADEPDSNFDEQIDHRHVKSECQLVCVPLRDTLGQVVGAVEVLRNASSAPFTDHDADLLHELVKHLYFAVTNTSLLTKMCQCNERLSAIAPELHPKEVTPMLAQIAQRICSAERVNIFVCDGEDATSFKCFDEYSGHELEIPLGQGFVGRCGQQEEAILVQQMLKDAQFNPNLGVCASDCILLDALRTDVRTLMLTLEDKPDQRHGITIQHALYVPIRGAVGYTSVVVEILNKMCGALDKTDEIIGRMVGMHAHGSMHRAHELRQLEGARTQALSLLTSVQYLYPYTGGTSEILHSAVAQLSIVMQAQTRIFLSVFNEEGQEMDDLWKCYDKSSGSPTMMSIEGVAGSCYRNVTPVRLHSAHVWDEDFSASTSLQPEGGATHTSAFLCQPIMDNVNKRPIGVVEFRRTENRSSRQPIQQFSDFEEEQQGTHAEEEQEESDVGFGGHEVKL